MFCASLKYIKDIFITRDHRNHNSIRFEKINALIEKVSKEIVRIFPNLNDKK